jgi:hypothetical protein
LTTTEIFIVLKTWLNNILNASTTTIGNCVFTNGSSTITGTNFITNGVVTNDGFVKRTSDNIDFFAKVLSFTETAITLYSNYMGTSGSGVAGEYIASYIPVIRGEQSAPKPKSNYLVIHQPMPVIEYASGNYSKADNTGTVTTTNHYQATINIEEIGFEDNGDKLRLLLNSLRLQTTKDYFKASKVSILRNEGIVPIPSLTENKWELRSNMDLIILFPDEGTYKPGYIEIVEFDGTYNT